MNPLEFVYWGSLIASLLEYIPIRIGESHKIVIPRLGPDTVAY